MSTSLAALKFIGQTVANIPSIDSNQTSREDIRYY